MHWVVHLKDGPKKYDHAAVAVGHKVYSFGGHGNARDRDQIGVHVFNTVSLRWAKLPPVAPNRWRGGGGRPADVPSMRRGHTAALIDDVVYIWGGIVSAEMEEAGGGGGNVTGTNPDPVGAATAKGEKCNVLYAFDVAAHRWSRPRVSGAVPEARCLHSACVSGKAMYIFGGYQRTRCTNDIHRWDAATALWSLVGSGGGGGSPPPPASSCHSATIIGTKMFVFGGGVIEDEVYYNAVSVFDTEAGRWLSAPQPPSSTSLPERRGEHSAFSHDGQLYIFGGHSVAINVAINDLWRFCPRTSSWRKVEPRGKGPRSWVYMMCCCMVGDRVVLFGRYRGRRSAPADVEDLFDEDDDDEVKMTDDLYVLDLSPSLKTLCKLAVVRCGLERSGLPHDIRWELSTMSTNSDVLLA